ncbi:hypothetical protein GGI25_004678 [Coemansia spiralis]|uniref:Uncharacterized protein n=2 Tax=Coemansia TaxID=4863 RepID=A0A9W8KWF2_9FUNG|nr:hypothetical protein EDC05_005543 [Coemansia umbellata]KAJ2620556.1 hypothetical protein GGI26_004898 [Coemansia sp. RSA 1358]KAJ2673577.1 hypothetical protein GGI25_004678 [Coemansia spiralis]
MSSLSPSSSLSYRPHISRRRSSAGANNNSLHIDTDTASWEQQHQQMPSPGSMSAIEHTYVCKKCGLGTELLSVYMPHTAYPCGEQPMENSWGKL